jgi:hypothetical protein
LTLLGQDFAVYIFDTAESRLGGNVDTVESKLGGIVDISDLLAIYISCASGHVYVCMWLCIYIHLPMYQHHLATDRHAYSCIHMVTVPMTPPSGPCKLKKSGHKIFLPSVPLTLLSWDDWQPLLVSPVTKLATIFFLLSLPSPLLALDDRRLFLVYHMVKLVIKLPVPSPLCPSQLTIIANPSQGPVAKLVLKQIHSGCHPSSWLMMTANSS